MNQKKNLMDNSDKLKQKLKQYNFRSFLVHAPYAINICSNNEKLLKYSKEIIIEDIKYMESLFSEFLMYNVHPGNHLFQGINKGINIISNSLNEIINKNKKTIILIETMSGKGTEVGSKFEDIAKIIDLIENKNKIGVCIDTCHIFSAGYDIVNQLSEVLDEFNTIINIKKLKAIHLNDSFMKFNSKKDRHEKLGKGFIGLKSLIEIINHSNIKNIPFILETPNDVNGYKKEIELLKNNYNI